jgi:hypothetical protein
MALGILQLSEARKKADAQLSEMRNQRAAENFLAEERLRLGQQQLQASEAQAEVQAQIALERAKLDAERIKAEREATVARSVSEFGRSGFAFIPTHAADKIPTLLGTDEVDPETGATRPTVATIEMPGYGTILQRIGGPGFEKQQAELAKINALTEKYNQDAALSQKRAQVAGFAQEERAKRIAMMEGKFSNDSLRLANNIREGLRKQAADLVTQLTISTNPEDKMRARKAAADLRYAFPEDSRERALWERTSEVIAAGMSAQQKGIPLPSTTDVETVEALGLDDVLFGEPVAEGPAPAGARPVKVVGRITDERGQTFLIGERGERIPSQDTSTPVSQLGTVNVPAEGSTPTTGKRQATPEDIQRNNALVKKYQSLPRGSAEREAARQELIQLRNTIEFTK